MDSKTLAAELAKPGRSQAALARMLKIDPSIVSKMVGGTRDIKVRELPIIEAYFAGTAQSSGLPPREPVAADPQMQFLPIRYRVQAGAWLRADAYAQEGLGFGPVVRDPAYATADQWLEEVVGNSMNLEIKAGSLVHVIGTISIRYAPRTDDIVIIERRRHNGAEIERSIKQVVMTAGGVELWGRSTDEVFNAPIVATSGLGDREDAAQGAQHDSGVEVAIVGWVRHVIRRV